METNEPLLEFLVALSSLKDARITSLRQAIVLVAIYLKPGITNQELKALTRDPARRGQSVSAITIKYMREGLIQKTRFSPPGVRVTYTGNDLTAKGVEIMEEVDDIAISLYKKIITEKLKTN